MTVRNSLRHEMKMTSPFPNSNSCPFTMLTAIVTFHQLKFFHHLFSILTSLFQSKVPGETTSLQQHGHKKWYMNITNEYENFPSSINTFSLSK